MGRYMHNRNSLKNERYLRAGDIRRTLRQWCAHGRVARANCFIHLTLDERNRKPGT